MSAERVSEISVQRSFPTRLGRLRARSGYSFFWPRASTRSMNSKRQVGKHLCVRSTVPENDHNQRKHDMKGNSAKREPKQLVLCSKIYG